METGGSRGAHARNGTRRGGSCSQGGRRGRAPTHSRQPVTSGRGCGLSPRKLTRQRPHGHERVLPSCLLYTGLRTDKALAEAEVAGFRDESCPDLPGPPSSAPRRRPPCRYMAPGSPTSPAPGSSPKETLGTTQLHGHQSVTGPWEGGVTVPILKVCQGKSVCRLDGEGTKLPDSKVGPPHGGPTGHRSCCSEQFQLQPECHLLSVTLRKVTCPPHP